MGEDDDDNQGRNQYRKPPPKKPIKERVEEARELERVLKTQKTQAAPKHKKIKVPKTAHEYQNSKTSV